MFTNLQMAEKFDDPLRAKKARMEVCNVHTCILHCYCNCCNNYYSATMTIGHSAVLSPTHRNKGIGTVIMINHPILFS